jgi:preprotein translocase subunit SecE
MTLSEVRLRVLMNTNAETGPGALEIVKLAATAAILVGGIVGFYAYEEQSLLISVSIILGAVAVAVAVFMQTDRGRTLWKFIQGARVEIRKVIWPTRTETVQTTLTVFVFVLILGIFFWILDFGLLWVTRLLTGQGS